MDSDISLHDGKNSTEQMFLLECQVKRVLISSPDLRLRLGSDDLNLCENTRLTMTFMNYPEIELCENEEEGKRTFGFTPTETSCGKSCLFALSDKQLLPFMQQPVAPCSFAVQIRVYGLDSFCGDTPASMFIGCCAIPMGGLFSDMLNESDEIMDAPVTCMIQEDFPLKDTTGIEVGTIFASVRVSCFGKMILAPISLGNPPKTEVSDEIMQFDIDKAADGAEGPGGVASIVREEIRVGAYLSMDGEFDAPRPAPKGRCGAHRASSSEAEWPRPKVTPEAAEVAVAGTPEPVYLYEEIRAKVNGHSLFFKILKKGKQVATGGGRDARGNFPAVEAPGREEGASLGPARGPRRSEGGEAEGRQGSLQRGPSAVVRRSLQARTPKRSGDGSWGLMDPEWEDSLARGHVPVDGLTVGPSNSKDDEVPVRESRSKELFSISVGQQVILDGEVRPKLLLEIRAPKTKEDLEEEDAAIDAVEDRQKRREDRKHAMAMVSDGTQFLLSDIGVSESPNGKRESGGGGGSKTGNGAKKGKKK